MIDPQKLEELSNKIVGKITNSNKKLLSIFPITKYIEYIEHYPKVSDYKYVSQEVKNFCERIIRAGGEQVLELYHQLLLVNFILNGQEKIQKSKLPQDIKSFYNSNFERITNEIESATGNGSYNYAHDKFHKNLGVCSLRMIPAGVVKIHLAGIPRRFLFKRGVSQFIEGIAFILFELGGTYPLFEMHLDSNDPELMADFSEEGWIRFYRRVSELLKMQPDVKGVGGGSWFFDPELEKISPRLVYLRKIVTDNGGKLFYLGPSSQSIKDATFKSPTRRRLYEEKKYIPTSYLLVWPRKKLISWADKKK